MANGEKAPAEKAPVGSSSTTNVWDFLRAAIVLAALVVLTLAVTTHYGKNAQNAATILGITAPVLAAIVGGTLGYYAGNNTGKASGQEKGEEKVKQNLGAPVKVLDSHLATAVAPAEASRAIGELKGLAML